MKGTVNILDFIEHLQQHNLVIVPQSMVTKDCKGLQKRLLSKNMATYKEIADSAIWGDVTKTRVYQIARQQCRTNEILILRNAYAKDITKITRGAIERIARIRGIITTEL
jgi:hypothetical protein